MQKTSEMCDRLINEFAENYMEKLFYFCLKKTGSHIEAEDLTQDIVLQIISASSCKKNFERRYGYGKRIWY